MQLPSGVRNPTRMLGSPSVGQGQVWQCKDRGGARWRRSEDLLTPRKAAFQGMILAPKPAAWLLLPGSGAFGLETVWLGPATSESLQDSNYDGATTEVGLAVSGEPNEARRRAQRE